LECRSWKNGRKAKENTQGNRKGGLWRCKIEIKMGSGKKKKFGHAKKKKDKRVHGEKLNNPQRNKPEKRGLEKKAFESRGGGCGMKKGLCCTRKKYSIGRRRIFKKKAGVGPRTIFLQTSKRVKGIGGLDKKKKN